MTSRREQLLESHPELRKLEGIEPRSKWIALALVGAQMALSLVAPTLPWWAYLSIAYAVGATIAQALFLAIHELTHNLFFTSPAHNRWFAIVCNTALVVPFTVDFRTHHLKHHAHLGVCGVDTDVPSDCEMRWVVSPAAKAVWWALQIVAYAVRPIAIQPQPLTSLHMASWAVQLGANALLVQCGGSGAPLRYLLLCMVLAGGVHPCAGHFLSEHYVFERESTQETTSYYGPLNRLTWNVGYHNEHHDLPQVPWSRLPRVRSTAPEFYNTLVACPSWTSIGMKYVVNAHMGPWRRIVRVTRSDIGCLANERKST